MTYQELEKLEREEETAMKRLADELTYDEYYAVVMLFLQQDDFRRITDFWIENDMRFVEYYSFCDKEKCLAIIFPEKENGIVKKEHIKTEYPQYDDYRFFDYYDTEHRPWCIYQLFYDYVLAPPILEPIIAHIDKVISPIHDAVVSAEKELKKESKIDFDKWLNSRQI